MNGFDWVISAFGLAFCDGAIEAYYYGVYFTNSYNVNTNSVFFSAPGKRSWSIGPMVMKDGMGLSMTFAGYRDKMMFLLTRFHYQGLNTSPEMVACMTR